MTEIDFAFFEGAVLDSFHNEVKKDEEWCHKKGSHNFQSL